MTEHQWLTSTDLQEMLRAIDPTLTRVWKKSDPEPWRVHSDRKMRLFAIWLFRNLTPHTDYHENMAVEWEKKNSYSPILSLPSWFANMEQTAYGSQPSLGTCADVLRDIFGNPYQPVVLTRTVPCDRCNGKGQRILGRSCGTCDGKGTIRGNADWLTWRDGLILTMAQDIYDNCRFDELPILADALEEAGCQDRIILDHLRSSCPYCKDANFGTGDGNIPTGKGLNDPVQQATYKRRFAEYYNKQCVCKGTRLAIHVRGCWVVDLLLGKE